MNALDATISISDIVGNDYKPIGVIGFYAEYPYSTTPRAFYINDSEKLVYNVGVASGLSAHVGFHILCVKIYT